MDEYIISTYIELYRYQFASLFTSYSHQHSSTTIGHPPTLKPYGNLTNHHTVVIRLSRCCLSSTSKTQIKLINHKHKPLGASDHSPSPTPTPQAHKSFQRPLVNPFVHSPLSWFSCQKTNPQLSRRPPPLAGDMSGHQEGSPQ